MPPAILVNGAAADSLPVLDRGLQFGDGVFRTLAVSGGRPLNWVNHHARLSADCRALGLSCPESELLAAEIAAVAPGEASVKIIVTRGVAGRGYAIPEKAGTSRVVAAFDPPAYDPRLAVEGVRVRLCTLRLAFQPRLAGVKSLNRLENVLARGEWRDRAVHEGLLCDSEGRVIEGTMANVFVVRQGRLVTPRLDRCGVAGAQRDRVRQLAASLDENCDEVDLGIDDVMKADEVFLTNSLIRLWPVREIDGRAFRPGPVARVIREAILAQEARDAAFA
jgi:4-amino-4-deoxychorismate lyase